MIFIADLIACSTCFGHHYAHHQEFKSVIQVVAPNTTGSKHLYNTLELMMMGIVVPETCWASKKICNKNHLLHLVVILFPHKITILMKTKNVTNISDGFMCFQCICDISVLWLVWTVTKTVSFRQQHHFPFLVLISSISITTFKLLWT
jgi:hypothetical protein